MSELTVYCDGGKLSDSGVAGVAAVAVDQTGKIIVEGAQEVGQATSNEAEYLALSFGISLANLLGARTPHFVCDSLLVVQQISGWWAIRGGGIALVHGPVRARLMDFDYWSIQHVPREQNKRADWLVNVQLRGNGHARTLKTPPTDCVRFRAGELRPGWKHFPKQTR